MFASKNEEPWFLIFLSNLKDGSVGMGSAESPEVGGEGLHPHSSFSGSLGSQLLGRQQAV